MSTGVTGPQQRVARSNRFLASLFPMQIFFIMSFEFTVESNKPLFAAFAVSDNKRTGTVIHEKIPAVQLCNFRDSQARRQSKVYDEIVPYRGLVVMKQGLFSQFPGCPQEPFYLLWREELAPVQNPVEASHFRYTFA